MSIRLVGQDFYNLFGIVNSKSTDYNLTTAMCFYVHICKKDALVAGCTGYAAKFYFGFLAPNESWFTMNDDFF